MDTCLKGDRVLFWKQVDKINARELVTHTINAIKEQIAYAKAFNTSQRVSILFGKEVQSDEYHLRAEIHYQKRNSNLNRVKFLFDNLVQNLDEKQRGFFKKFIQGVDYRNSLNFARKTTILRLLDSSITVEDTKRALEGLDNSLAKLESFGSLEEMNSYVQDHVDEITGKKMGNPVANPLCVLLLLITSMYIILMIVAILICVLICIVTLGFFCKCDDIVDRIINQACGG